jgi:hypothetical protein
MSWMRSNLLLASTLAVACAFNPPPVPLVARAADVEALAGRWTGSYHGEGSGRSGSIEFILVAGEDHAHGDVVMVAPGTRHAYQAWRETTPAHEASAAEVLTIRFVAVDGGEVSGELDPYRDPACDCRAVTRFRGRAHGDTILGTFVTYTARATGPSHGTWKVRRQRS